MLVSRPSSRTGICEPLKRTQYVNTASKCKYQSEASKWENTALTDCYFFSINFYKKKKKKIHT